MKNSPDLFDNDTDFSNWEPADHEIAIAVELNTIPSFRSQFRRLKTRYCEFASMKDLTLPNLELFTDWFQSNKEKLIYRIRGIRIGTEFEKIQ